MESGQSLVAALNGRWHRLALQVFLAIVVAHWAEHLLQAVQVFVLHWPRPQAGGGLGLIWPWLVTSEWLHYGYAVVMLAGLIVLRRGFQGRARKWWTLALAIQVWHHAEHALLLGQALLGINLLGAAVPTSIAQLMFPRVELHLFYNAVVFLPMVVAMYYHVYPPAGEQGGADGPRCACARRFAAAAAFPPMPAH